MEIKRIVLLAALLMLPVAYAAPGNAIGMQGQLLSAASVEAQCRVDFMVGYLNAIVATVPNANANLGADVSALRADMATLQGYASSGDAEGYRSYLKGTFDPAFKDARNDIESRPWKGTGNETLSNLKTTYSQLRQTLESCQLNAAKSFAQAKVAVYQQDIENYSSRTSAIAGFNGSEMNTGELDQVVSEAQSQILAPLQAAISSADSSSVLRAALNQYCLYDGCQNGENFHLAVRYEFARSVATLSSAQLRAGANGSNYFAKAQQDLSSVQSALSAIGTSAYTDSNRDQLQNILKTFNDDLRQAMAQMMQARAAGRNRNDTNQSNRGFGPINGTNHRPITGINRSMINGINSGRAPLNVTHGRGPLNGTSGGIRPANPQGGNNQGGVGQ